MDAMDVDVKSTASKPKAPPKRPVIKDSDSELSEEEDVPLAKRAKPDPPAVEQVKAAAASNSKTSSNGTSSKKRPAADSSDDEKPLAAAVIKKSLSSKAKTNGLSKSKTEDSDSDAPLSKAASSKKSSAASSSKTKLESPAKKRLKASTPASSRAASTAVDESDDDDGEGASDNDEEEDDEEEDEDGEPKDKKKKKSGGAQSGPKGRGAQKWTTLYHTGPRFPPPYEALPSNVQLKYDGKPVRLPPESEEAAMFYAVKLETQHARDAVFNKNFFQDYKKLLAKHPPLDGTKITDFSKIDFRPLYEHHRSVKDAEVEAKKQMAPSARKLQLEEKKKIEAEMKTCVVDGVEQKVGNVVVEPPALFLGRGEHPKKGRIKQRIAPEQITINHTLKDKNHPPPAPPPGHKWRAIKEDKKSTWLAFWKESINGNYKYMYLDATSNFKSNSDRDKFEKARQLDNCIVQLRAAIDERLTSKQRFERQLGTVVWLIDNYSLRAGNEKGEDEAATYGVCSLLVEHVKELKEGSDGPTSATHEVKLEFLGKDSMKFKETLTVPARIFKNFRMFTQSTRQANGEVGVKNPTDEIFDKVDTGSVNKFLQNESNGGMKGLSAKVFRTYNASVTFQGLLDRTEENLEAAGLEPTPANLKDQYNTANRLVAILCNHQKTVNPVMSEKTQARHEEKMISIRYERYKERQRLLTYGKADEIKKNFPVGSNPWVKQLKEILKPVEISAEEIVEHEERMIEAKKERLQANFNRAQLEREFHREQGEKGVEIKGHNSQKDVDEEKATLDAELRELVKERKSNKSRLGASKINVSSTAKKILGKIVQLEKQEAEHAVKNKTSDVSLGTSKLNYIDPRITVAWLKKWDAKLVELNGEPQKKKQAAKKGGKAKKEESEAEEEDVKPAKGKKGGASAKKGKAASASPVRKGKGKGAAKKEEEDDEDEDDDEKPKKESEKMELDLKIMPLTQYFPQTMLKKFRWAQYDEDGEDLPAEWVFVEDAHLKVKTNMSSANRKPEDAVEARDEALALEVVAETKVARVQEQNARKSNGKAKKATKKPKKDNSDDDDDDDDESSDDDRPLAAAKAGSSRKSAAAAKDDSDNDSSDDDAPLASKK